MKKLLLTGSFLAVLLSGCQSAPITDVQLSQICKEFSINGYTAEKTWVGKVIEQKGRVSRIGSQPPGFGFRSLTSSDSAYVSLASEETLYGKVIDKLNLPSSTQTVLDLASGEDKSIYPGLAELKSGQAVKFQGKIEKVRGGKNGCYFSISNAKILN